jgi:hypothetical protein
MSSIESVYKPHILDKARELIGLPHAVQRDAEDRTVWWVKGLRGSKYRVQLIVPRDEEDGEDQTVVINDELEREGVQVGNYVDGFRVIPRQADVPLVSCSCPNGMNRGGRPQCYHTAAVLLLLEEGKADEAPTMTDPNPLNEDFTGGGGDAEIERLRAEGYTDTEIEFLRS